MRAAEVLGSDDALCVHLGVDMAQLARWKAGDERPPLEIFLRAVDILTEASTAPARARRSAE